jgi:hypothetical protein
MMNEKKLELVRQLNSMASPRGEISVIEIPERLLGRREGLDDLREQQVSVAEILKQEFGI